MDQEASAELLATAVLAASAWLAGWVLLARLPRLRTVLTGSAFGLAAWPVLIHVLPDRTYLLFSSFPHGHTLFGSAFFLCGVLARAYSDTSLRRVLQGVLTVAMIYFVFAEQFWFAVHADEVRRLQGTVRDGVTIQTTYYSCVPASLATVLRRWRMTVSEGELAYRMRTSFQGTSPVRVIGVVEDLGQSQGFTARVVNTTLDELMRDDRPAILFGKIGGVRHAVALVGLTDRIVTLGDPLRGKVHVARGALERELQWSGLAVTIHSVPGHVWGPSLRVPIERN